ncbi:hypothetical protein INR49_022725, partial [Caranx melampygus]
LQVLFPSCSRLPGSAETDKVLPKPRFHLDLWLGLVLHSWILDVGRLVVMLLLPANLFPLNRPGAAVHLGLVSFVMATSFHLVADSVTRRLLLIGYELHLSVRENPVIKNLEPSTLVDAFELLFYYDHTLGHLMWYVPFFLTLLLFFSGCFCCRSQETFILFTFTFFAMTATVMHQRRRGLVPDGNGLFMLYSFSAALLLLLVWVVCLWDDAVLRRKHPGLIYVPQPRAVYTLHLRQVTHT